MKKNILLLSFLLPLFLWAQTFTNYDLNPLGDSYAGEFTILDSQLFFMAERIGNTHSGLWTTNGTPGQTQLVAEVAPLGNVFLFDLVRVKDHLMFRAQSSPVDTAYGVELWISDGTASGTHLLKDILPGPGGSNPSQFTVFQDTLYFTADDGFHGRELWKSDGTAAGTQMVMDLRPGPEGSNPYEYVIANNRFFFNALDSLNNMELWVSDGSETGTLKTSNFNFGSLPSVISNKTALGDLLLFSGRTADLGPEIWVSNGTDTGTFVLQDIYPGTAGSFPSDLQAIGDSLYFAAGDAQHGREVWVTDGSISGTHLLIDINGGSGTSAPGNFFAFNGTIFFSAIGDSNGNELWVWDGNSASLFMDVNAGTGDSNPRDFILFEDQLYFTAHTNMTDRQLYQSDGTSTNTLLIEPPNASMPNSMSGSSLRNSISYNGGLYFGAHFDSTGRELWRLGEGMTGIMNGGRTHFFQVYPNPIQTGFEIDLGQYFNAVELEIIDLSGKKVYTAGLGAGQRFQVDWVGESGMYILRIVADGRTMVGKALVR